MVVIYLKSKPAADFWSVTLICVAVLQQSTMKENVHMMKRMLPGDPSGYVVAVACSNLPRVSWNIGLAFFIRTKYM